MKNRTPSPEGTQIDRMLPHSLEGEQGVLGSMLIAPEELVDEVASRITPAVFYHPAHTTIYEIILDLSERKIPLDIISLTQTLRERKQLDSVGGAAFITSLIGFTPTAANAMYYVEIVLEKYLLRELIAAATEIATCGYDDAGEAYSLLDNAEARILAIREKLDRKDEDSSMKDEVMAAVEQIERLYENRGQLTGLPTGFKGFDNMTGGLQKTDMIVIAGRPSMGKSALAGNIIEHVALVAKQAVGVFSAEMSTQQLVQRFLCSRARVNVQKVRDGFLSERDFPNLTTAAAKLAESQIFIDSRSSPSIMQIRAKARRWKKKYGIKLLVVDYLQLLRSTSRRGQDNRVLEVAEISAGLKGLAKELDIPIIVLAQLNRKPEERSGGKPRMSDLKESGAIEQDADLVALLTRAEYYADDEEAKQEVRGEAILDIVKQRNGPVGEVKLTFLKEYTRFEDRADTQEQHT